MLPEAKASSATISAGRRFRWALAVVVTVLLVNLLWLSNFRARWTTVDHGVPLERSVRPTRPVVSDCGSMDRSHRDPLFAAQIECIPQNQVVAVLRKLVLTAAQFFVTHNVTYFLDSGTLLGAFRNASVIAYDTDADMAIDEAGFTYLSTTKVAVPEPFFLTVYASGDLYPRSQRDKGIPVRLIHKPTALYVDVFVFETHTPETTEYTGAQELVGPFPSWAFAKCERCTEYYNQGKQLLVPRDWIYLTVGCVFEGVELQCPRETEKYLRYMFGDDFRTPIQY